MRTERVFGIFLVRIGASCAYGAGVLALLALLSAGTKAQSSDYAEAELRAVQAYDGGDIETAADLWSDLAEAGSLDAALALASLVEPGGEGRTDLELARSLYLAAAAAGDPLAANRLERLDNEFGAGSITRAAGNTKSEMTQ